MEVKTLCSLAVAAIIEGRDITLHLPAGQKWPPGFPRGELLSVNDLGRNASFDPLKVLAHVQRLGKLQNNMPKNRTIK